MKIITAIETLNQMMDNTDYDDEFNALSMGIAALTIVKNLKTILEDDDDR